LSFPVTLSLWGNGDLDFSGRKADNRAGGGWPVTGTFLVDFIKNQAYVKMVMSNNPPQPLSRPGLD
jgi:hypothetical protein